MQPIKNFKALALEENQLWTYSNCPAQYDMAYEKKLIPTIPLTAQEYLGKITSRFFLNIMNGNILTPAELKKLWEQTCLKYSNLIPEDKVLEGLDKLLKMYRWAENLQLLIADVNIGYVLGFLDRSNYPINIRGVVPAIAYTPTKELELLVIDYGQTHTNPVKAQLSLKYTLWVMAIEQQMKRRLGIHIHNAKYDKDIYSYRDENDFMRLKKMIENVSFGIRNKVYYPRESIMCNNCIVSSVCRAWKG